jgi:hypothetical protein
MSAFSFFTSGGLRYYLENGDELEASMRKWGPLISGGLFSAAWWSWANAVISQKHVEEHPDAPSKYVWPTIIATLSLVLINMLSRDQLQDIASSGDEETNTRARLWLLCSFLLAFGAVGGSVSVLVAASEGGVYEAIGWGSVVSTGFILLSSLMLWRFRSEVVA